MNRNRNKNKMSNSNIAQMNKKITMIHSKIFKVNNQKKSVITKINRKQSITKINLYNKMMFKNCNKLSHRTNKMRLKTI